MDPQSLYKKTLEHLKKKKKILFLTTSNRWTGNKEDQPKSTQLAFKLAKEIGDTVTIIEAPKLKIYPCEGNVSSKFGNVCGVLSAKLNDPNKNPTGHHRCFASINNPDDELWKISKELFISDCVVFFGSVRWGQINSYYQTLIERLTWLENRHTTLQENNLLSEIEAGIILIGQNWRGQEVLETEKEVLSYFGFKVIEDLCWNWQFTKDSNDENSQSYQTAAETFNKIFMNK